MRKKMNVKVIQADTRPMKIFLESRNLTYGPANQMDFGLIASLNKNILVQPTDSISLCRMLNLIKCRHSSVAYEFILGDPKDWESDDQKAHCWIKIDALIKQIKNPENKGIELFCFLDSDAWIRDEGEFLKFCTEFLKSDCSIAVPRDIELSNSSFLNTGFIAVKNNEKGLHVLETIFAHPEYREYDKKSWHEQSNLSIYHERNPGEVLVLPLNDFNTPCGRIVRHCWAKHLIDPLILEETVAYVTRVAISITNDSKYVLGQPVQIYSSS